MTSNSHNHDKTVAVAVVEAQAVQSKQDTQGLISRLSRWLDRDRWPVPSETRTLFSALLTDVAANRLAKEWSARYIAAEAKERRALLAALVQASAELQPRSDQGVRLFRRLYAQADSLQLLVDMRADMLRWRNQIAGLGVLERELEGLLSNWFDVGMLEVRAINWDSPASLLEKLIQYEAVHEIHSWGELRHRVAKHRRCYAFFHPRMNDVPLIFVEVAFAATMSDNVQSLLDPEIPADDPAKARWAIFYSISNTQSGLRGISFGSFLLKRVIDQLLAELPKLKFFATLSPIPGFTEWLGKQDGKDIHALLHDKADRQQAESDPQAGLKWVDKLRSAAVKDASDAISRSGLRLAAHYLKTFKNDVLLDPVARFHLGNGARIERLNWAADSSEKGLAQSCGMMVNYVYELGQLDDNLAQLATGKPKTGTNLRWL